MKKLAVTFAFCLTGTLVHADDKTLTKLDGNNASQLERLGKVPVKNKIEIDLGDLRTGEAELPPKPLTYEQRMELRAKRTVVLEKQAN